MLTFDRVKVKYNSYLLPVPGVYPMIYATTSTGSWACVMYLNTIFTCRLMLLPAISMTWI